MKVEAINLTRNDLSQVDQAPEQVDEARKKKPDLVPEPKAEKDQVQAEEILKQIKALTEEGVYSVQFENDKSTNSLVVKIVDQESNEVIRQMPAEELLELKAALTDLRGNLIDTQS